MKDYSLVTGAWKALRAALFALLALLLASGGLDIFFNSLLSSVGIIGIPVWSVPLVIGALNMFRNWLKVWLGNRVVTTPPAQ